MEKIKKFSHKGSYIVRPINTRYEYEDKADGTTVCRLSFEYFMRPEFRKGFWDISYNVVHKTLKPYYVSAGKLSLSYTLTASSRPSKDDAYDKEFGRNMARSKARRKLFSLFANIHEEILDMAKNLWSSAFPGDFQGMAMREDDYMNKLCDDRSLCRLKKDNNITELVKNLPNEIRCSDGEYLTNRHTEYDRERGTEFPFSCEYYSSKRKITFTGKTAYDIFTQVMAFGSTSPRHCDGNESSEIFPDEIPF